MSAAELFKVTCVTCQARLSVRNESLIGQIIACPRCNSMVEIASPAAVVAGLPAAIAPVASPPPASVVASEPVVEAAPPAPVSVLEPAASSTRMLVWSIASFVFGVSVTGTYLLWRSHNSEPSAPAATTPPAVSAPPQTTTASAVEPAPTAEARQRNDGTDTPPAAETDIDHGQAKPLERPTNKTEDIVAADTTVAAESLSSTPPSPAVEETVTPTTAEAEEPAPRLVIEPADGPRIARHFDPLRLDPDQLDLSTLGSAASSVGPSEQLPAEAAVEPDRPNTEESAAVPSVVRLSDSRETRAASRSASQQLQLELPRLSVQKMPLMDFLMLASSLSAVPISVDPSELLMAGLSPGKTVSLDAEKIGLEDALERVLEPLHLEATVAGSQVVIQRQDAELVRTVDYPIDDLVGDKTTVEMFAKWIEQLIASDTWKSVGGSGTVTASAGSLRVEQSQAVQYQVLFLLERIRLAKGLPLRSRFPARLLSDKPLLAGIADRLAAPTTFTFSHETPLAEVFRYWQSEMGMPVFVDWPALASANVWPESRVTCTVANQPWHSALDAVLTPLSLGWRAVPGGAIQITTASVVNTDPQWEIFPAAQWQNNGTPADTVIHDQHNQLVYVRAPASRLRLSDTP